MLTSLRSFEGFVRGKAVVAADGQAIGELTDLLLDSEQWQVQSLHLKLTSDAADKLGIERGRFHEGTVDLAVDAIRSVGDTVIILKGSIPGHTATGSPPTLSAILPSSGDRMDCSTPEPLGGELAAF